MLPRRRERTNSVDGGAGSFQTAPAAGVAQPVEHLPCKQGVRGSTPLVSSPGGPTGAPAPTPRPHLQLTIDFPGGLSPTRARTATARGDTPTIPEGCPSGQREQTVNLPALPSMVRIHHPPPGGSRRAPRTARCSTPPSAPHPGQSARVSHGAASRRTFSQHASNAGPAGSAGVAQLVERQPSKLNVAGSNPVSRSGPRGHGRVSSAEGFRPTRPPSSVGRARPW